MATPVNCALSQVTYGLQKAGMRYGDTVVVQGAGGLGLNAIAVAKEMGADAVIAIDGVPAAPGAGEALRRRRGHRHQRVTHADGAHREGEGADRRTAAPTSSSRWSGCRRSCRRASDAARRRHVPRDRQHLVRPHDANRSVAARVGLEADRAGDHVRPVGDPGGARLPGADEGQVPAPDVVSHKFKLDDINNAFEMAEWQGKNTGTAATRVILKP